VENAPYPSTPEELAAAKSPFPWVWIAIAVLAIWLAIVTYQMHVLSDLVNAVVKVVTS